MLHCLRLARLERVQAPNEPQTTCRFDVTRGKINSHNLLLDAILFSQVSSLKQFCTCENQLQLYNSETSLCSEQVNREFYFSFTIYSLKEIKKDDSVSFFLNFTQLI